MPATLHYLIANCCFKLEGENLVAAVRNLPGFSVFETESTQTPSFVVKDATEQADQTEPAVVTKQYSFGSEGVESAFSSTANGYLLQMSHEDGSYLHLWTDTKERIVYVGGDLRPQLLRFALWMAYGIMNANQKRIAVHGSCIVNQNRAYLFLGESGTGKSTHTRLWREHITGSTLLNDDSPIIAVEDNQVIIYGSPWSGKTPCYKKEHYPLGGCVRLTQAPYNKIQRLTVLKAFAAFHPSCPPEFAYDEMLYAGISESIDAILSEVPIYHLACLPDAAAAELSYQTLVK